MSIHDGGEPPDFELEFEPAPASPEHDSMDLEPLDLDTGPLDEAHASSPAPVPVPVIQGVAPTFVPPGIGPSSSPVTAFGAASSPDLDLDLDDEEASAPSYAPRLAPDEADDEAEPVRVATDVRSAIAVLLRDRTYWRGVARCLVAPFIGIGALWLLILPAVLMLATWMGGLRGVFLELAYLGLLANYFAKCIGRAMDDELAAPPLEKPNDVMAEYVLPGVALIGLSLLLWAPAGFTMYWIVSGALSDDVAILDGSVPLDEQMQGWNPDEVFTLAGGQRKLIEFDDPPAIVKRANGVWVKVIPAEGIILIIGPDYDPASGDPFGGRDSLYDENGKVNMDLEVESEAAFATAWRALDIPIGKIFLLVLCCLLALYYWPMGLATAALGDDIKKMFNPVRVLSCAVRGGPRYGVVVGVGFVIVMLAMLVASQLSWGIATFVTLGSIAYIAGAQGFLMGTMFSSDPELLAAVSID